MDQIDGDARVMTEGEFYLKYGREKPEATYEEARDEYRKYIETHGKQASDTCYWEDRGFVE